MVKNKNIVEIRKSKIDNFEFKYEDLENKKYNKHPINQQGKSNITFNPEIKIKKAKNKKRILPLISKKLAIKR